MIILQTPPSTLCDCTITHQKERNKINTNCHLQRSKHFFTSIQFFGFTCPSKLIWIISCLYDLAKCPFLYILIYLILYLSNNNIFYYYNIYSFLFIPLSPFSVEYNSLHHLKSYSTKLIYKLHKY